MVEKQKTKTDGKRIDAKNGGKRSGVKMVEEQKTKTESK